MTDVSITYSRNHGQAYAAGVMWGLVFGVEAFALSVLAIVFLPEVWLRVVAVLALVGGPAFVLLRFVLAPIWTYHTLTPDALILRYGRDRLAIPRSRIVSVESVHERLPSGYQTGFSRDATQGRITAALSPSDQLLIRINPPLEAPATGVVFPIREALINADNPEPLLALVSPDDGVDARILDSVPSAQPPGRTAHHVRQHTGEGITCTDVSKRYGDRFAVESLTLRVAQGEIYGLLGPNGAGKSTVIAMLAGITAPDRGNVRLAGHDLLGQGLEARRVLGYMPDRPILYDTLTGREFLSYIAQLHALSRKSAHETIDHLIDVLDFGNHANSLCRTYSFGTRSKVALAAALLHDPQVLVLDEPFNGLDPQSSYDVRSLLVERANAGAAILLSTHDLTIAELLCDRIGILARGRLVAEGDLDRLTDFGATPLDVRFRTLVHSGGPHIPAGAR